LGIVAERGAERASFFAEGKYSQNAEGRRRAKISIRKSEENSRERRKRLNAIGWMQLD
jgi:hypothetical protein